MQALKQIEFIDNANALRQFCAHLQTCEFVALDTEFIREHSYRPQLCLIQVASKHRIACIDPLAIHDLSAFYDVLYNDAVVKILHAAAQDLEIFYCATGKVLQNLFDTQIAAVLLGHSEQLSLATLVATYCQVQLDKSQSRTNWLARPLKPRQIAYAADDVRYLPQIYSSMHAALCQYNRMDALNAELADLKNTSKYQSDYDHAYTKVRGGQRLSARKRAILKNLSAWREQLAEQQNITRRMVLNDDALLLLVHAKPQNLQELNALNGINATVRKHAHVILAAIADAEQMPVAELPPKARRSKGKAVSDALLDELQNFVHAKAKELHINANFLASRNQLQRLVNNTTDCALLQGWRFLLIGQDLQQYLRQRSEPS